MANHLKSFKDFFSSKDPKVNYMLYCTFCNATLYKNTANSNLLKLNST